MVVVIIIIYDHIIVIQWSYNNNKWSYNNNIITVVIMIIIIIYDHIIIILS